MFIDIQLLTVAARLQAWFSTQVAGKRVFASRAPGKTQWILQKFVHRLAPLHRGRLANIAPCEFTESLVEAAVAMLVTAVFPVFFATRKSMDLFSLSWKMTRQTCVVTSGTSLPSLTRQSCCPPFFRRNNDAGEIVSLELIAVANHDKRPDKAPVKKRKNTKTRSIIIEMHHKRRLYRWVE